jgi:hypothetical protein
VGLGLAKTVMDAMQEIFPGNDKVQNVSTKIGRILEGVYNTESNNSNESMGEVRTESEESN